MFLGFHPCVVVCGRRRSTPAGQYTQRVSSVRLLYAPTISHFFLNVLLQACYFSKPFVWYEEPFVIELEKNINSSLDPRLAL